MIIAFTGYAGVGKTTAANHLIEQHGFVRHNFKDPIVAEIKQNFPDTLEAIRMDWIRQLMAAGATFDVKNYGIDKLFQSKPQVMRALMQNYGTEVRRKDDPNYWTKQWCANLPEGNIVVDDVRFLNEAAAVKSMGGIIIRLTRPDVRNGGDHQSETEQREIAYDYIFDCEVGKPEQIHAALDFIV